MELALEYMIMSCTFTVKQNSFYRGSYIENTKKRMCEVSVSYLQDIKLNFIVVVIEC